MLEIVQAHGSDNVYENIDKIKGISYRKNGSIILNESRTFMSSDDLNNLPFPAWHLFTDQALPMFAGRGWPFRCKFCMRVQGNSVRMRSDRRISAAELEILWL
jgi:radical SAM superfamily enzyme YgiQ (UPF0313 family)